jgi:hypothetical protein
MAGEEPGAAAGLVFGLNQEPGAMWRRSSSLSRSTIFSFVIINIARERL